MKDSPPKIVLLITTDEQRRDTLSIYGCKGIDTPNIDSIGQQGSCFDNAYTVSPWCLPSRCSILTGCYPHRHGAYSNFRKVSLSTDKPNLYTGSKAAGYTTAHFGKCHFEPVRYGSFSPDETAESPETKEYYMSLGIDYLDLQDDKNVSIWQYDDYSRELDKEGYLDEYRRRAWHKEGGVFEFPGPAEWHPDAWVGRRTAEYIKNWNGEDKLFVWLSFSGPHYPIDPPEEYLDRVRLDQLPPMIYREGEWGSNGRIHYNSYNGGGGIDGCGYNKTKACRDYDSAYWERMRHYYLANMALIDDQVGDVLRAVEQTFGDDSLVMFTSDHGDMLGNHWLWGKNNCGYDEVLKIPFLLKGKGFENDGNRIEERIQTIDIFPTVLDSIGTNELDVDGAPIRNVVQDGGYDFALAEGEGFYCITSDSHKLVKATAGDGKTVFNEFFDLSEDPYCFDNRYPDPNFSKEIASLQRQLLERYSSVLLP